MVEDFIILFEVFENIDERLWIRLCLFDFIGVMLVDLVVFDLWVCFDLVIDLVCWLSIWMMMGVWGMVEVVFYCFGVLVCLVSMVGGE